MLARLGVTATEREIFRHPLAEVELRELAALRTVGEIFAWGSVRARREGWRPGDLSDAELLRLMSEDPTLVRRPLVRIGDRIVVGHEPAALEAALTGPAGTCSGEANDGG